MKEKILIVAAHPDDEILGCGGTVARLVSEGFEAYSLILGEGVTSRDDKRNVEVRKDDLNQLEKHIKSANDAIGIKDIFIEKFPDNRFDSVPLLDIVKVVEAVKNEIKPNIIFTHYEGDLNIDHKITNKAVLTATRPLPDETVKELYAFEVLSSTEWSFPLSFSPDTFFDISGSLNKKIEAMKYYFGELRDYPHPRSIEGIELNAKNWGMKIGCMYAEAFKLIRTFR